jgi:nucleoside-diphosphate kinase
MINGPCIVLEIRQENVVKAFRDLVGPMDPEIAKNLRPNTLRAKVGMDRIRNAIHCTDLPEDGTLESEYWFSIQQ